MIQTDLRPHQIFYLEQGSSRLYGELIQVVAERNLCWLRPIALYCLSQNSQDRLSQEAADSNPADGAAILYDLSQGADLICPDSLLRPALDTDLLPLLAQLHDLKTEPVPASQNLHRLRQFIQQLWQAEPEAFRR